MVNPTQSATAKSGNLAKAADPNETSVQVSIPIIATGSSSQIPMTSRASISEASGISHIPDLEIASKQLVRVVQTDIGWLEKYQNNRELKKICNIKGWDISHYQLSKFKDETGSILWIPEKITDFNQFSGDRFAVNLNESNQLIYIEKTTSSSKTASEILSKFVDLSLSAKAQESVFASTSFISETKIPEQSLLAQLEPDHTVSLLERAEIITACKARNLEPSYYYLKNISGENTLNKRPARQLMLQPSIEYKVKQAKFFIIQFIAQLEEKYNTEITLDKHVQGCIQTMVDGTKEQDALFLQLENPLFSRANFIEIIEPPENKAIFIANFKDATLKLSNRTAGSELRAAKLQALLHELSYVHLKDLLVKIHLTAKDPFLIYTASSISSKILASYGEEDPALIRLIKEKVRHLRLYGVPLDELLPRFFSSPSLDTP